MKPVGCFPAPIELILKLLCKGSLGQWGRLMGIEIQKRIWLDPMIDVVWWALDTVLDGA